MIESLCTRVYSSTCLGMMDWTCEGHLVPCGSCMGFAAAIMSVMCGQTVFPALDSWYTESKFNQDFGLLIGLLPHPELV